jgi:hypothetical protein
VKAINKIDGFCQKRFGAALRGLSPSIVVAVGGDCVVTEIGETQRILPHAISQELTLSSSGALVAATEGSTRPVTGQGDAAGPGDGRARMP